MEQLESFDYEDYRRHQGVRHPRTVVAVTEDKDLLLVTIDGRWAGKAEGMSAKEVTLFLKSISILNMHLIWMVVDLLLCM